MLDFDFSQDALFEPGGSTQFFGASFPTPSSWLDSQFCRRKALWFAELSRLVYGPTNATDNGLRSRAEWLHDVGLSEVKVFENQGTMAMLVRVPMTRGQDLAVLSFRGTHAFTDWISNLDTLLIDTREGGLVHKGFSEALDRIWPEVALTLRSVGLPIVFTGHSLGGALATIAASRLPGHGLYTFGSPRVGNAAFNQRVESSPWYRVVNGRDLVCQVPPPLPRLGFTHGGTAAYISQEGELRLDPESWQMTLDQLRLEWWTVSSAQRKRLFLELPKFMTDHAPINYVAHLQRLIFAELRS